MSAPTCLYCNDTGVLCTIETAKGVFKTYCTHCSAGVAITPPPTPTPPTDDVIRE